MKQFFRGLTAINVRSTLLGAVFIVICALIFIQFLDFNEARSLKFGFEFSDPAFSIIPGYDVSLPIFTLTYGSLIVYLIVCIKDKEKYSRLMVTYGLLILFRMITLSILPLRPPSEIIFLDDPFLNTFIYPGRIDADLFFSGHTALIFGMFFLSGRKWIFIVLAIVLGILLVMQRTHYSIDILGALPFAYFASKLSELFHHRWPLRL